MRTLAVIAVLVLSLRSSSALTNVVVPYPLRFYAHPVPCANHGENLVVASRPIALFPFRIVLVAPT